MNTASVAVIIVNWNNAPDTIGCLSSLLVLKKRANLSVLVVDNGSTDRSLDLIRTQHPWPLYLKLDHNFGFTGGNNAGIKKILAGKYDFLWLLNNDTTVSSDFLSILKVFTDPKVGAVSPKIYFSKGSEYHQDRYKKEELGHVIWYAGGMIDWENMYAFHRGVDEVDHGQYDTPVQTDFVTGCAMVIPVAIVKRAGLFDERYYLYYEDLDYSLRLKRLGLKTMFVPEALVWHHNSGSSGRPGNPIHQYYQTRNRLLVGLKYANLRTKAALLRESLRFLRSGTTIQQTAVKDALFGRYGEKHET